MRIIVIPLFFLVTFEAVASLFGEENIPLAKLVIGQIEEIRKLSEQVNLAKDQASYLSDLNKGIDRAISQIESIGEIISRSKSLNPNSIRSLSELNELISSAKTTKAKIEDLIQLRGRYVGLAVDQSALQVDTAYRVGQELVKNGSDLIAESNNASPGRSSQIAAASLSSQTLAKGIELQTLAHIAQLQAISLELQRNQIEQEIQSRKSRQELFRSEMVSKIRKEKKLR